MIASASRRHPSRRNARPVRTPRPPPRPRGAAARRRPAGTARPGHWPRRAAARTKSTGFFCGLSRPPSRPAAVPGRTRARDSRVPVDPSPAKLAISMPLRIRLARRAGRDRARPPRRGRPARPREVVRPARGQPLERDVEAPHGRALARVKGVAVDRVHDHRHPGDPRRRPSEDPRLAAVRVHDHGGGRPRPAGRRPHLAPQQPTSAASATASRPGRTSRTSGPDKTLVVPAVFRGRRRRATLPGARPAARKNARGRGGRACRACSPAPRRVRAW